MSHRGPPYPGYGGSSQPPPPPDWAGYRPQYPQQPGAQIPPLPQQPPPHPTPEQASLYANYGYGNQWRPPPAPTSSQPLPPPPQPQFAPPPSQYPQPTYSGPYHPSMPIMYMQPSQPPMNQQRPPTTPGHAQQPPRMHNAPPQPQPYYSNQVSQRPIQQPPLPPAPNNNGQRYPHPPAKRPRTDSNYGQSPSHGGHPRHPGPSPTSSFPPNHGNGNGVNVGPPAPPFSPSGPQMSGRGPHPPTGAPPPPPQQQPPAHHNLPPPPPPQPAGPPSGSHGGNSSFQGGPPNTSHGRFPPQQPGFKGRGGQPASLSSTKGRTQSQRGGGSNRGPQGGSGAGRGSGRGGSHSSRGSFRSGQQNSSHRQSGASQNHNNNSGSNSQGARSQSQQSESHNQPVASGLSSTSFNPSIPSSFSFTPASGRDRVVRQTQSFTDPRERERRGPEEVVPGTKKTFTDFRIVGVDCPILNWSWGTITRFDMTDLKDENENTEHEDPLKTPTKATLELPSSWKETSEVEASPAPSNADAETSKTQSQNDSTTGLISATAAPKGNAETSRIRIYFNSPIDHEEKRQMGAAATAAPIRGGKRKKEEDDEGEREFEEGGKRIKQEVTVNARESPSMGSASLVSKENASGGVAGAKRKAASLSGDEEEEDVNRQLESLISEVTEVDAEADETEYAGSPRRHEDPANGTQGIDMAAEGDENDSVSASQAATEQADYDPADSTFFPSSQYDYSGETQETVPDTQVDDVPLESQGSESTPKAQPDESEDAEDNRAPPSFGAASFAVPTGDGAKLIVPEASSESRSQIDSGPQQGHAAGSGVNYRTPSANRVSISYAGSSRRLVLDAEIVEKVKIFRASGRIEVKFTLQKGPAQPSAIGGQPAARNKASGPSGAEVSSTDTALVDQDESAKSDPNTVGEEKPKENASTGKIMADEAAESGSNDTKITPSSLDEDGASLKATATVDSGTSDLLPKVKSEVDEELLLSMCRGIMIELLPEEGSKEYVPVPVPFPADDPTLPNFPAFLKNEPVTIELSVYLDRERPLSEPKWVRTGDVEDLLHSVFGKANPKGRGVWERKVEIIDPDPPPTIYTILDNWVTSSNQGVPKDRRRFIKEHMQSSVLNILEIVLRQVRGAQPIGATMSLPAFGSSSSVLPLPSLLSGTSSSNASSTFSPNAPHAAQHSQSPVSLMILSLWQMSMDYAEKASEERTKVEAALGKHIIKHFSQGLIFKSVDMIFKDWCASRGITLSAAPSQPYGGAHNHSHGHPHAHGHGHSNVHSSGSRRRA